MLLIAEVARAAAERAEANLCRHHDVPGALVHECVLGPEIQGVFRGIGGRSQGDDEHARERIA
jgi:hypothetical protein